MAGATVRIAVGIPTWQDGDALIRTLASVAEVADVLIIADGPIAGVERHGWPIFSELDWIDELDCSRRIIVERATWSTQAAKRNRLLWLAQIRSADWLVQIDADEELHAGDWLRPWLEQCRWLGTYPIPFEYEPGRWIAAPWKCLHVPTWRRIVAQGCYVEHANGITYSLLTPTGAPPGRLLASLEQSRRTLPHLTHHPELRPAGRDRIRLGELENTLEPPLVEAPTYPFDELDGLAA